MSNIRLFFSANILLNSNYKLDKSQSHYLTKVMRVKVGESFSLFNKNGEWKGKIYQISKSIVEFSIIEKLRQKENTKEIWLAFSPIKSNYFNFMIQKATELGVTKFIPIIFDRTIVRKVNKERLEKIIIEATEQSNRINVPLLEKPQNLKSFISKNIKKIDLVFTDLNTKNKKIEINKMSKKPLCIIIGPEGDFSEKERNQILNFEEVKPIKINENILRAETAAISSISIIKYVLNL
ncbi:16S rRNA (uracil(1498)-N(3))-methyltransferase [Candidatus Pelagibacter sp.]|nr:16S rRNA (uracil(1498)-N(3))-methyltransferase [Candidatus Pelagibacter sp.]